MAKLIIMQVPGRPCPKARARVTAHGTYTPAATAAAEEAMQWAMREQCPVPLVGPLELRLSFCFRRPNSWTKAQREAVDEDGEEPWHTKRPDLDNLVKLVKDAGNGVLWRDDCQVVQLEAFKVYGAQDETMINLRELEDA